MRGPVAVDVLSNARAARVCRAILAPETFGSLGVNETVGVNVRENVEVILVNVALDLGRVTIV